MDHAPEPEWEQLKRREELRKSETSLGGRQRYVSPLELFRMQLDAEAVDRLTTSGETVLQSNDQTSGKKQESSADQPASPDDCEVHHQYTRSLSEADMEEHILQEPPLMEQPAILTKESWLRCMFPFKQRRKASKLSKRLDHFDISVMNKDTCFRNPLYKSKVKSKGIKEDDVEASSVSASYKSQTRIGKLKGVENSEGSKRISTAVSCSVCDRRKSSDGIRCSRHAPDHQLDSIMGAPDFGDLLGIYTRAGKFPLGRCQTSSASPMKRGYSSLGAFKKALLRSRMQSEDSQETIASTDQMLPGRSAGPKKDRRLNNIGNNACLGSCVQRKKNVHRKSNPPIQGGHVGGVRQGQGGKNIRMGELTKNRSAGGRSARGAEDGDAGYTAFVPFQGFDVFANQTGGGRTNPICQQSVGSISSTDESRNSGSRYSGYSKNSDRIYQRK